MKNRIDQSPYNKFQNFARITLITGQIFHLDYSDLRTLNQEVGRIGNNVNQMAKLANQFEEIAIDDVQQQLTDVQNLQIMVSSALKKEIQKGR